MQLFDICQKNSLPWRWRWATDEEYTAFRQVFDLSLWHNGLLCGAPYFEEAPRPQGQLTTCNGETAAKGFFTYTHIEFGRGTEWNWGGDPNTYNLFLVHDSGDDCGPIPTSSIRCLQLLGK